MAHNKLHALRRIRKYLALDKAILLNNMFINSQFNYAPLIWVFCSKTLYHKIEKIYHKTLNIIYQSEECNENLLLDRFVSVNQIHLYFLVTEIYKSKTQINPEFTRPYFIHNNITYNLRNSLFA